MPPLSSSKVAIATLWDGVPDYACAVLHYCQHAQRLADAFVHGVGVAAADLVMILTDDHMYEVQERRDCRCKARHKKFCPECPGLYASPNFARDVISSDCPHMKLHAVDPKLREATLRYATRPGGGCRNRWQAPCLATPDCLTYAFTRAPKRCLSSATPRRLKNRCGGLEERA